MKTDRLFKCMVLSGFAGILFSCSDFLVRNPEDQLSPETYFKNATECRLYTDNFYTMFPSTEIYSESADYIIPTTLGREVIGDRPVPSTSDDWKWKHLRAINFFLEHSKQCPDDAVRTEYEGVARFFRAWFYFEKVKRYGDVPWLDHTLGAESRELYKGRDPRKEVMAHILEDIDFAIESLPDQKNIYRISRWTAYALKSRIFLFEGTFRKYQGLEDWESCLTDAAEAAEAFMTRSGYTIYSAGAQPYRDLFANLQADPGEIILARSYGAGMSLTHDVNGRFISMSMGRPGLAKDVVNMYLMSDGSRFTDKNGWQTMTFAEETADRDPRLMQSIRTPGYIRIGGTVSEAPNMAATTTGYQLIKYVQSSRYDAYNSSEVDLPLFRAAEVYLNFAEAKAELGTITQSDLDKSVNVIRSRVRMPGLSLSSADASVDAYLDAAYPGVTGPHKGVILEIRRERTIELLNEGLRYWDIMRWKQGQRFVRSFEGMYFATIGAQDLDGDGKTDFYIYTPEERQSPDWTELEGVVYLSVSDVDLSGGTSGNIRVHRSISRTFDEAKDYLYPIPTSDIVLTSGAIKQNPGWKDGLNF